MTMEYKPSQTYSDLEEEAARKKENTKRTVEINVGLLQSVLIDMAFSAWTFMLGIGALHLDIDPRIPNLNYAQALLVVFTLWQLIPSAFFKIVSIEQRLIAHWGQK